MLVVIDESGCPGFKFDKGSTEYFVIAMVIFDDLSIAEKVSEEIAHLRKILKVKPEFKFSKTPIAYFIRKLMEYAAEDLKNAYVKIDGSGDNEFRKALRNYLNQYISQNKIKKFKFVESHRDNLIQLVDMIAGAIARAYNPKRLESNRWLIMLRKSKRISGILEFRN